MTDYYKQQREIAFRRDNYRCVICSKPATQQAHILARTKVNLKKYGERIINHHANLRSVCSLSCNSAVLLSDCKTELVKKQIEYINRCMND